MIDNTLRCRHVFSEYVNTAIGEILEWEKLPPNEIASAAKHLREHDSETREFFTEVKRLASASFSWDRQAQVAILRGRPRNGP